MFLFSFVLKIWLMGCAFCACLAFFPSVRDFKDFYNPYY